MLDSASQGRDDSGRQAGLNRTVRREELVRQRARSLDCLRVREPLGDEVDHRGIGEDAMTGERVQVLAELVEGHPPGQLGPVLGAQREIAARAVISTTSWPGFRNAGESARQTFATRGGRSCRSGQSSEPTATA